MLQTASRFSHVGIFFGVAIVLGYFAGAWVDRRIGAGLGNTGKLVGILVGVVTGFRELYRLARAFQRSAANAPAGPDDDSAGAPRPGPGPGNEGHADDDESGRGTP